MAGPPAAARIPAERTHHGDTVVDEYAWLADKDNPETIAFLEAENAYTQAMTAGQAALRSAIFGEIKARTQETDLSVPARKGGWWYYTRTVEGQQYAVHCRRAVRPDDTGPPLTADGGPLDGEEILLDGNELAAGQEFFSLGTFDVSPDGRLLAYSTDFAGGERFTLRVKDLVTGETAADEIPGTFYGGAWSADGSRAVLRDRGRGLAAIPGVAAPRRHPGRRGRGRVRGARRAVLGRRPADPQRALSGHLRLQHADQRGVAAGRGPAGGEFTVVAPRRQGVEYEVEHQVTADGTDRLLILHNDARGELRAGLGAADRPGSLDAAGAAPRRHPAARRGRVRRPPRHLPAQGRADRAAGAAGRRQRARDRFPRAGLPGLARGRTRSTGARAYRLGYGSLVTPDSVYDCDTETGALTLLRRHPVLPLPGGAGYDPADYEQHRLWATAPDGTQIPISLVCRAGLPRDGTAPFVLYGYGSYEISIDPGFSIPRLSLLDRGFGYAIAHIRGGGELGRRWYDDGKMLSKINTFTDFVACARHLAGEGWTSPQRLVARGGSAGGLLVGAALNIAPDAFGAVVAQVPFVDALTSVLDPSVPLTVTEWEEWGDPLHDPEAYQYIKSYSPYENIATGRRYPPVLALTSLNDIRVRYTEPAKWIARLQARAQGGPFLLKTELAAGHGGRSGRYDAWHDEALVLAWIVATAAPGG